MHKTTGIIITTLLLLLLGPGCATQPASIDTSTPTAIPDLSSYPWVYQRDEKPLAATEETISVIAVGDILLGRGVAGAADPLRHSAGWLQDAHLTLGNLEGVLVNNGTPRQTAAGKPEPIILHSSPASAELLRQAGFDIISLANNHSLDYGSEGLLETITHLQNRELAVIGTKSGEEPVAPLIQDVAGLRLAFLAFNAVPDPHPQFACSSWAHCSPHPLRWDPQTSPQAIAAARSQADALIVSVHWGFEYHPWPDPGQESMAETMLAAGADLIIGHHPHVPQRITIQGEQLIVYSLGNFLFDQEQDDSGNGLALRAFFDQQGLRAVQALPVNAGLQPRLMDMAEAEPWLLQLFSPDKRQVYTCTRSGCMLTEAPATNDESLFYSGQIDLTGDGLAETIRRQGEQITIYEQGTAVWQSPPAWRVVDVALGDPNDDGRYEIMLAIWQKDADGYERSQPYIIGHRDGRYDLLWGGRPVADPILELAVGDVDGDGSDELVVIEELADGSAQALSVWRWAGWTFSHVWRSEIGAYSDLLLVGENQPLISVVANNR
jgi:poly-gamma-glutamate synthesis protein (capsule biosynthesis protein)